MWRPRPVGWSLEHRIMAVVVMDGCESARSIDCRPIYQIRQNSHPKIENIAWKIYRKSLTCIVLPWSALKNFRYLVWSCSCLRAAHGSAVVNAVHLQLTNGGYVSVSVILEGNLYVRGHCLPLLVENGSFLGHSGLSFRVYCTIPSDFA